MERAPLSPTADFLVLSLLFFLILFAIHFHKQRRTRIDSGCLGSKFKDWRANQTNEEFKSPPFFFIFFSFLFLKVKKRSQSNARDCTSFLSERTEKRFLYLLHSAARHSYKLDPVLENLFSSSSPKPFRKFRKKRKKKKRGISIVRFINFYDKTCGVIGWKDRSWDWTASGTRLKVNKTELERKK